MQEIEDSTWEPDSIRRLNGFEDERNLVLRATKETLSDFYSQNFHGNETVLEVGSGTGFLRRSWPDGFRGEWMQLDSQPCFLEEAKRRLPKGVYINGSAYELPFHDESLDVVCGFGSYDVLFNLEKAIKEASRVLRKGGLFFHVLDMHPCDEPVIKDFNRMGIYPNEDGAIGPDGYVRSKSIGFIPKDKMKDFEEELRRYGECPDFDEKVDRVQRKYEQRIDVHDYFEKHLIGALLKNFDGETIESGKLSAKYKGRRTKQQMRHEKGAFVFFSGADGERHYENATQYNINKKRFPAMLNLLPSLHSMVYRTLGLAAPSLAQKIEPYCLEISTFRYAKARK